MIKSAATPSLPKLSQEAQPKKKPQAATFGWGQLFGTFFFRLLLLGIGGSVAAVVGIAIAQLYPAQTQEPPSLARMVDQAQSWLRDVGWSLVQNSWVETSQSETNQSETNQVETNQAQSSPAEMSAPPLSTASTGASLTASERQQLQVEITQLQAELQTLTSQSDQPLANRVAEIQKRIQMIQERLSHFTTSQPVTAAPLVADSSGSNTSHANRLIVTLPSDALFAADQATLRPDEAILNNILTDLQRYPQATIEVGAHTDQQAADQTGQDRSLEQAKAVQQYLSTQLPEDVHWVTIGYGHSRPLVPDDSSENRQRNRRIEILITP